MTDVEVVVAALGVGLAAAMAWDLPWWVVALAVGAAVVVRHPWLAMVALVMVAANRGHAALSPLDGGRSGRVEHADVTVLSDPAVRFGRWQFDVSRGDEHDAADLSLSEPAPVVGEHLVVDGATSPMPAEDWSRARHLRARLRIDAVADRSPPPWPLRLANAARDRLVGGATSLGDRRPLFSGLVLGDDRDQDALVRHRFRASGLAHLLAVSGQNVAFVLVACSPLLRAGSLRWRWAATVVLLAGFTLVTRWEPSVLRAVVMAAVAATAHLRGRYASGIRRVAVATILLVLADPLLVWSAGFRLSVAASAALVLLQRPIARRLPGPAWLADPLATVLAAQVGTTPLLLAMGMTISSASIPANLLAVPVAGWIMVWGLTGGAVAAVVGGPVAALLHRPTAAMLGWVDGVAAAAASPRWPVLGVAAWVVVAAGVGVAVTTRRRGVRIAAASVVVAALVAAALPAGGGRWNPAPGLQLVRSDGGAVALVAGGQVDANELLDDLTRRQVRRVDLAIFTSASRATTALAATLRDAVPVGRVLASPGLVRDAADLRPGAVVVGTLRLVVERDGPRWVVRGPV
jgi:ComEC/Rec2-related protein